MNDKFDIINENILTTKRLCDNDFIITINPEFDVNDLCFIIKELMIKFSDIVYVDYIIKCPYNSTNNEINLQDLKLITLSNLNEKLNTTQDEIDKFNKQRNIISPCMNVNNHKINIINFNIDFRENNSILQIKKEVSHVNLVNNDKLARNTELLKVGTKKPKKFKKISFNNLYSSDKDNLNNNRKENMNIQKYTNENDEEMNSKENSHRIDDNYINGSFSKYKDTKVNSIGKKVNDFNVNEINRMGNLFNMGNDLEILRGYKDKQISPSTAATEKSYHIGVANSRRILNDSELGRSISNLK